MNTLPQKSIEKLLLTPKEAAKALSVCERTLYGLTKEGEIPAIRLGRCVRYPMVELQKWIEKKSFEKREKNLDILSALK